MDDEKPPTEEESEQSKKIGELTDIVRDYGFDSQEVKDYIQKQVEEYDPNFKETAEEHLETMKTFKSLKEYLDS